MTTATQHAQPDSRINHTTFVPKKRHAVHTASAAVFALIALLALLASLACAQHASAESVLEYRFNEAAGSLTATASMPGGPDLTLSRGAVISGDGTGVSGASTDRAFDNRATTGQGATSGGGRGTHAADFQPIDALTTFTLSGWFRTDAGQSIGSNATIWDDNSGSNGLELRGGPTANAGTLTIDVDTSTVTSDAVFGGMDEWIFFAVTYDGNAGQPGPNVFFFQGTTLDSVTGAGSGTLINGPVNDEAQPLFIGGVPFPFGQQQTTFAFDGLLDNLRLDNSLLAASDLEAIRLADSASVTAIPEPATMLIGALGSTAICMRRRRRSA